MRTPTDAPVLTNFRQNHSVHTGVAGASVTRISEGRTLDLPEGQKGLLEGRERGQGWGRGRHPIQGSRGWGGVVGTPQQVHGRVGGRWDPQGVCFTWRQTGPPSLLSVTVSTSATPGRQGASVAPAPHTPAPSRPRPRPGPAPAPPRPRCLRAPGTCPSADVPRRWCDCFSAVIFNRL